MINFKKQLSIVIPAKNEGEGIRKIIQSVKNYADDIIVVDGHSEDNTRSICLKENVRFYTDNGKGRGAGVILGIKKANYNTVIFVDADGSHETKDIPLLISTLLKTNADMVITSRRTGGSSDMLLNLDGLIRSVGSDIMTILLNYRFKTNFTDILYSFRIVRKDKFEKAKIKAEDFSIEQEMLINFLKMGYSIIEIPSREKKRAWGKSKLKTSEGPKLLIKLLISLYK